MQDGTCLAQYRSAAAAHTTPDTLTGQQWQPPTPVLSKFNPGQALSITCVWSPFLSVHSASSQTSLDQHTSSMCNKQSSFSSGSSSGIKFDGSCSSSSLRLSIFTEQHAVVRAMVVRGGAVLVDVLLSLQPGVQQDAELHVPVQTSVGVLQLLFSASQPDSNPPSFTSTPGTPHSYDTASLLAVPPAVAAELSDLSHVMGMDFDGAAMAGSVWRDHRVPLISGESCFVVLRPRAVCRS